MSIKTRRPGSDQPCSAHTLVRTSRITSSIAPTEPGVFARSAIIRRNVDSEPPQHPSGGLEHPKVGATIPADVQHQQAVNQQTAPVNDRHTSTPIGHRTGEPAGQTKPIRVLSEGPQTTQRDDLVGLIIAVISHRRSGASFALTDAFHPSLLVVINTLKFAGTERICRART